MLALRRGYQLFNHFINYGQPFARPKNLRLTRALHPIRFHRRLHTLVRKRQLTQRELNATSVTQERLKTVLPIIIGQPRHTIISMQIERRLFGLGNHLVQQSLKENELVTTSETSQTSVDYSFVMHHQVAPVLKYTYPELCKAVIPSSANLVSVKSAIAAQYHKSSKRVSAQQLHQYIEHLIFLFRSGLDRKALISFLDILETSPEVKAFIKKKMLVPAKKKQGERWATGMHEWIPRNLIANVITAAAGLYDNKPPFVLSEGSLSYVAPYDWFSLAQQFRSPNKHLYFCDLTNKIIGGHPPALMNENKTQVNKGSHPFHQALSTCFHSSSTLYQYVDETSKIASRHLVSHQTPLYPTCEPYYTVNNLCTANEDDLRRLKPIIQRAHNKRQRLFRFFRQVTEPADRTETSSTLPYSPEKTIC